MKEENNAFSRMTQKIASQKKKSPLLELLACSPLCPTVCTAILLPLQISSYHQPMNSFGAIFMAYFQFTALSVHYFLLYTYVSKTPQTRRQDGDDRYVIFKPTSTNRSLLLHFKSRRKCEYKPSSHYISPMR